VDGSTVSSICPHPTRSGSFVAPDLRHNPESLYDDLQLTSDWRQYIHPLPSQRRDSLIRLEVQHPRIGREV
jgi:hypothetical protein